MDSQDYTVGRSTISVVFDSIVNSKAEVVVSSDDCELSMGGGVSEAIKDAAGPDWEKQVHKIVPPGSPARVGDVVVTPAGHLAAKYVLHAVTLDWRKLSITQENKGPIVRQLTRKVMDLLPLLQCRSVALPSIGTGVAGYEQEEAASEMAATLAAALLDSDEEYRVELHLLDRFGGDRHRQFFTYFEGFLKQTLGLAASESSEGRTLQVAGPEATVARGSDPTAERRRILGIFTMLRHLDMRRDRIEARLVAHVSGDRPLPQDTVDDLRRQLAKIEQMRHGYEADLRIGPSPGVDAGPTAVFLSSTFEDLKSHRVKTREKVLELGFKFIGMENFPSWPERPAEFIQLMVEKAHVYLGILGMRYGFVDKGSGLSMTELEYRRALAHDKPVHMFVMDKDAPITPSMVETDPDAYGKLIKLKAEVLDKYVCSFFRDEMDLAQKVEGTLKEIKRA